MVIINRRISRLLCQKIRNILLNLFFLSILLTACNRKGDQNLENAFWGELLLEHGGAYTLFGSKPITIEELFEYTDDELQHLRKACRSSGADAVFVERYLEEGWKTFQKKNAVLNPNYILKAVPFERYKLLVFINVQNFKRVFENHREFFHSALEGISAEQLIEQLRMSEFSLWRKLLLDHRAKGILLGYGEANARIFQEKIENKELITAMPSEDNDPRKGAERYLSGRPFRLPVFAVLDTGSSKELIDQYKREREDICSTYADEDFFAAVLQKLWVDRL